MANGMNYFSICHIFFAYILFPFSFKTNLFLMKLRNFLLKTVYFDGTVKLFTRNNLFLMKL